MQISARFGVFAIVVALVLLALAAISGAASAASAKPIVDGVWVRLPAVPGRPAAMYAKISGSGAADRLIAVEGMPGARFELHTTTNQGGVMRMSALKAVDVPADAAVEMKPGGMHVMIFGMPATRVDAMVPVTFVFEKAGKVAVEAHAMAANATGHGHH